MKTNKEIKPFKMRVSQSEYDKIIPFMLNRGICWSGYFGLDIIEQPVYNDVMAITLEEDFEMMRYSEIGDLYYRDCLPELTYSEFMKLYGEEEDVFTKDDMKNFVDYHRINYSKVYVSEGYKYVYKGRENDWNNSFTTEEILTKFLSERAND